MQSQRSLALTAAAFAALLAGCGGGSSTSPLPTIPLPTTASAASSTFGSAPPVSQLPPPVWSPGLSIGQVALAGTAGNASSLSATLGSAPSTGSYLVAFVGTGDATTVVTPPAGWSAAADAAGHACRTNGHTGTQGEQVFVHRAGTNESATYAFSFSVKTQHALAVLEARNVAPDHPIDQCGAVDPSANATTGTVAAKQLTAGHDGELPLVGYAPSTTGLTIAPHSGWVTNAYTNARTKWMTLDAEYGPKAAAAQTVAPATTFGNLGAPTIVFAPSVALLLAPAPLPTVPPAPTPTPSATPKPIVSPTPVPTAPPGDPGVAALANGVPWPASFRPYSASSFWNQRISNVSNPRLLANSDRIIASMTSKGPTINTTEWGDGSGQDSHTVVFAHAGDPLVYTKCVYFCNVPAGVIPAQIHLPAKARSSSGGDSHLIVVEVDGGPGILPGTEIDMWYVKDAGSPNSPDWRAGDTISAGSINTAGHFFSGPGTTNDGYGADVGDAALGQGVIHYNELVTAGQIDHALFTVLQCGAADGSYVFPAYQQIDSPCRGGIGAPNGSHIWLDLSDTQIAALPGLKPWERVVLEALHNYGEYVLDTGCQGSNCPNAAPSFVNVMFEDAGQYTPFGVKAPFDTWAAQQGWNPIAIAPQGSGYASATRFVFSDTWNPLAGVGGWIPHLHIIDPCYARGAC